MIASTLPSTAWVGAETPASLLGAGLPAIAQVGRVGGNATVPNGTGPPDLIVSNLFTQPDHPVQGEQIALVAWVSNAGNGSASNFSVGFGLDNNFAGDVQVSSVPAGGRTEVRLGVGLVRAGYHAISASADIEHQVAETNETNNARSGYLAVTGGEVASGPDLHVTAATSLPANPRPGDNVTFAATIVNDGNFTSPDFETLFILDNGSAFAGSAACGCTLDPGASITIRVGHWIASPGDHLLTVAADATGRVNETNESNNLLQTSFAVAPGNATGRPDLVVRNLTVMPPNPLTGQNVTFHATLVNQGNATAGNSTLLFALDAGTFVDLHNVSSLAPGESVAVASRPWNAHAGFHEVRATADAFASVAESDETNNERAVAFTVAGANLPDLVVQNLTVLPPNPRAGQNVTFRAVILNQGNATARNSTARFELDHGLFTAYGRLESLPPGGMTTVDAGPWVAQAGVHEVDVAADVGGDVPESNETNNARATVFTVSSGLLPDLAVSPDDIVLTKATLQTDYAAPAVNPLAGINITTTIHNNGEGAAGFYSVDVRACAVGLPVPLVSGCEGVGNWSLYGLGPRQALPLTARWNTAAHAGDFRIVVSISHIGPQTRYDNDGTAKDTFVTAGGLGQGISPVPQG